MNEPTDYAGGVECNRDSFDGVEYGTESRLVRTTGIRANSEGNVCRMTVMGRRLFDICSTVSRTEDAQVGKLERDSQGRWQEMRTVLNHPPGMNRDNVGVREFEGSNQCRNLSLKG